MTADPQRLHYACGMSIPGGTLRDRKRERTRQAIVAAAMELFERDGYERTTIADIAAAADIGTRTFFSYFASKEDVLFPEAADRLGAAVAAIAARAPDDRPADVLVRALQQVGMFSDDLTGPQAALRLRLTRDVASVRGRGLQVQFDVQAEIARHLHAAFADELDEVGAAALVGAFVGAVTGALLYLFADPAYEADLDGLRRRLVEAVGQALAPWRA
jgi:AcrR family transcriptional regulator